MPKMKKAYDPWERYRGAVVGRMLVMDMGFEELAAKLRISRPTAAKYVREPGCMSLDQMRQMNRILDIEAEEARGLLPMK